MVRAKRNQERMVKHPRASKSGGTLPPLDAHGKGRNGDQSPEKVAVAAEKPPDKICGLW